LPKGNEAYLTHGMEDYFEPAIEVHHNDANPSSLLKYVSHTSKNVQPGVDETVITLQDDKYPVTVKLHYVAYAKENIIKTFTEISHQEKKPLKLERYASAMLHFSRPAYYLTEFSGDWIYEATMSKYSTRSWVHVPTCSLLPCSSCPWTKNLRRTKAK